MSWCQCQNDLMPDPTAFKWMLHEGYGENYHAVMEWVQAVYPVLSVKEALERKSKERRELV